MDSYDNVRLPDSVKNEQLLADTRSIFDKQLEEALQLSLQESETQCNQFEESIKNDYIIQTVKRREQFREFLFSINRVSRFDKNLKEVYEIIDPIIEAYCNQIIQNYTVDELTHKRIFQVLGTIRINKKAVELLQTIITKI